MSVPDVARVLLGVVLAVSAVTKMSDVASWTSQATGLGVAGWVARPVPFVEALLGGLLVSGLAVPWAAVAAVILLIAFTILLTVRLLQGARPPCACFGAWSTKPLGPGHVARNVVLLVVAMLATWS